MADVASSSAALAVLLLFSLSAGPASAQQVPDSAYNPPIPNPAYAHGTGPIVAIDAAHLNFHTASGRYYTFARLLERDGYVVESNDQAFTPSVLDRIAVLVISNAMHEASAEDFAPLPNHSAFTDAEVAAVARWVYEGGSLLLIADHMPVAGHNEALAAAFGIRFQNGFAFDSSGRGVATFRRSDGSLPASPVADRGRPAERIDSVVAFTGQAFRVDPDIEARPLLILPKAWTLWLPEVAWEFDEGTPRIPADFLWQGAALVHGSGRVAVFGEAAMFSAQLAGPDRRKAGMNAPEASQNYRFALNVLAWLTGR